MYAYTQSFIETAFFGRIPVLTKYLTRPFSINQHYCTFEKLCENFSLIVNSACLVAQWDQREIPIPAPQGISRLSAHQTLHNKIISILVLMWFEPCLPPGSVSVGVMVQGCVTAGRVVTPKHTPPSFLCVEIHS